MDLAARASSNDFNKDPYGNVPTEWICILFIVLFALSGLIHAGQAIYTRLWWIFPTICVAAILEIIGWSGRLWSSQNVLAKSPYLMQIVATIIAPTPLVAANFVILGQLIRRLGQCYSRLSAKWYTVVFCSCDVVALVVQAVGGATAAGAVNQNKNPNIGGHIMLAGIVFQMFSITVYMTLATEFVLRFLWDRPLRRAESTLSGYSLDRNTKLMLAGMTLSSVCIYIRSVYRTIELADGWTGYIIRTERFFDWLDGGMITLAIFTVNFFHPGLLLGPGEQWKQQVPVKTIVFDEAQKMNA
ncbi:RTA1-domain-containing protein [Laetiporus sulphureus 93-53]|uniref:RTA1-domain-containing protein n=1 Tax=Laetiporus sulphureus 93-53 TaxID=1314785 RepID=A0A165B678_9APHY|nr:RTA1-domain-containing protein [Laetiporus sulphureus 93-53]KZT00332.1 RTA1-domain-containing protein [Laetiporus sulphureus 93-53]